MHVVRHNNEAPDADVVLGRALAIRHKRALNGLGREDTAPEVRVEGNEIHRWIIFLKDAVQARGFCLALHEHDNRCSAVGQLEQECLRAKSQGPLRQRTLQHRRKIFAR